MRPLFFPEDSQFWYETLRALGHITYGGADFGEVAVTAERITPGDYDSWYDEWLATAERVVKTAGTHPVSRRDAYLRASNYYRTAEFFLHGNASDPRILYAYDKSVAAFQEAAKLLNIEPVEIPYENTTLPGYHYKGDNSAPTVIMFNGFDGSVEEMHFFGAAAAAERGYNVLTFDGPGQPGARHHKGLMFRPDWENVVGPVIDHANVDRVALLGNSMGGLLAPRAAAFDSRVNAVIALDGVYDLGEITTAQLPFDREEAERRLRAPEDPDLDVMLDQVMQASPMARWAFNQGMYAMGVDTPRKFCAAYLDYTLADGIAERITCPTLVCAAADDGFFKGQPEQLYEHLTCPRTFLEFTGEAAAHCQSGAQRQAYAQIFDWLDVTLL